MNPGNTPKNTPKNAEENEEVLDPDDEDAPPLRRGQQFHAHMALAHLPCGLFVTALVLYLLGQTTLAPALGPSAKICFLAGAAALPFVMASGIIAWRTKRRESSSGIFHTKLVWAILLVLATIATAGPEFYRNTPPQSFAVGVAICAALTAVLARMGTMIVFGRTGLSAEPAKKA